MALILVALAFLGLHGAAVPLHELLVGVHAPHLQDGIAHAAPCPLGKRSESRRVGGLECHAAEDTGEITGVDPVDLDMMRNNADFARIERLFAAATDVDELPVITADVKNKAAMDSWDVGMRDALREIYRTHLARIRKRAA